MKLKHLCKAESLCTNPKQQGLKYFHGAIGFYRRKVVSTGYNSRTTSWLQRLYANKVGIKNKVFEHAEIMAIRKAKEIDALLVVRVTAKGDLADSKPCKICMEAIKDCGIKFIYYSNKNGSIIREQINGRER